MYEILNTIHSPADVKKLNLQQLNDLAVEIREALFNRLTKIGGHFGPNFGIVEAEIALHYVFNSPVDKFVFDVSHQSYPHKMLTGRSLGYTDEKHFREESGYTKPEKSAHDLFNVGHTSTSISLASGLCKAREILGTHENVIALIGDGSLSGGEALEGLNVAGSEIHGNFIIVVNDNQQSISETHGGLYKSLADLRTTNGASKNNIFKAFGLDYVYEQHGNDIAALIKVFNKVKDIDHPIVVHINTQKGKGYERAETNKEAWHWTLPFDRETGLPTIQMPAESYTAVARNYILRKAQTDDKFVVVTPNMPKSFDITPDLRAALGNKFVDVGIAEEQSVAMASGIAKGGAKPLVVTNTTFMQRAYDQISQDLCINGNHVTILLNYANFDGLTDVTHLGIFGITAFSDIPNLTILAPTTAAELTDMLDWALDNNDSPVIILMPSGAVTQGTHTNEAPNTYATLQKGAHVAIIAEGDFVHRAADVATLLTQRTGIVPTVVNARRVDSADKTALAELAHNHSVVVTMEGGVLDGGMGQKIASYYGATDVKVLNYGLNKVFYDRYNPEELLRSLGMTPDQIVADVENLL